MWIIDPNKWSTFIGHGSDTKGTLMGEIGKEKET
jgi:hypothetical protein